MSYLTIEVEIAHGHIVAREASKLPGRGKGLLTVLETSEENNDIKKLSPLEAFHALQKSVNLDEAKAKAWMDIVRDARR
jgi:hypothetical protein